MRSFFILLITVCVFVLVSCQDAAPQAEWNNAVSKDSTVIAYLTQGTGDTTLVFIHGLSCDSRYWQKQTPYFSKKYQVVTIDLAGHGHSGHSRTKYSMDLFGNDVAAVIEKIKAKKAILLGHSMGGAVIVNAAGKIPDKVVGLVGVDTLQNFEKRITEAEKAEFVGPMKADFRKSLDQFARQMFPDNADKNLVDWVAKDMSSGPKDVAVSSVQEYLNYDLKGPVKNISCPIICVNADIWPTDVEANKRYASSYKLYLIKNVGHFLMLEKPDEFNRALDSALTELLTK
jgi:pimeloyl-ACP methyl ester carboxylesterase